MEHHSHIGRTQAGRDLWLSAIERRQHTAILGASGSGKSTLLEYLAAQDAARGDGFLVLDVSGALAEAVLTHVPAKRNNHICVVDISDVEFPIGLNLLEDTHPDAR